NPGTPVITASSNSVCIGEAQMLTTNIPTVGLAIIGTGTTSPGTTSYPNPLSGFYGGVKHQMIYLASELTAQGVIAGTQITTISFSITDFLVKDATNFTIRMGNTSLTALTGFITGTTTVYGPQTFTPSATGIVTFTLSTPFTWNGTSNIVVETVHNAGNGGNGSGTRTATTTTPTNTVFYGARDNVSGGIAGFDSQTSYTSTGASPLRPNVRFGFNVSHPTWTGANLYTDAAATIPYTGTPRATVYAKPTETTTYVATVTTTAGCSASSAAFSLTVNQKHPFYVDADGDGYGDVEGEPVSVCAVDADTAPAGYSVNNLDCNDQIAAINPGATEILYNGVDDNCDGNLDEGNQITTQIQASQCGTTVASIGTLIVAQPVAQATRYRFYATNTATNVTVTYERAQPYFSISNLPAYDYASTYSVSVEVQRNNVWLGYQGPACLVSSPAILTEGGPATITQCGTQIASVNTLIASPSIQGVTGYRFRVTNVGDPLAPNQVQVIDRSVNWFKLSMLETFTYGGLYLVEVAVKGTSGDYTDYGSPCEIMAPPVPSLVDCNAIVPLGTSLVAAQSLQYATSYRFEITNLATNAVTTLTTPTNYFKFNQVPNYERGAQYGVRVAVMTKGVFSDYGEPCEITAPGQAGARTDEQMAPKSDFAAVAYPNPFADNFSIDVTTSLTETIKVTMYDMTGRLLETKEVSPSEVRSLELGSRYPSGVYNVIVTQGENVKTLRVIKR
nr:T9SS type A sorting domain-containing protein [Flavobacterium sp.]